MNMACRPREWGGGGGPLLQNRTGLGKSAPRPKPAGPTNRWKGPKKGLPRGVEKQRLPQKGWANRPPTEGDKKKGLTATPSPMYRRKPKRAVTGEEKNTSRNPGRTTLPP